MGCCTSVNSANANAVKKVNYQPPEINNAYDSNIEKKKVDPKRLEEIIKKKRTEGPPKLQPLGDNSMFQKRKENFRRKSLLEDLQSTKLNTPQLERKRYGSVLVTNPQY